ncbi:MAG: sigma-70 family RNA polymerase sigma factor [Maribacter sp.]
MINNEIHTIWLDLNDELYHFILGKVKDEQQAKDLHQDVFLKIQTKIHQLQHKSKLTSWVYQITRNKIIDHFRKQQNPTVDVVDFDMPEEEAHDFDYSKLTNCINQKIGELSAQHKEAIVLTTFQEYSQKELAKHLNISYSGTKSRVQKAREILKVQLLSCPNVASDPSGKLLDFENNEE